MKTLLEVQRNFVATHEEIRHRLRVQKETGMMSRSLGLEIREKFRLRLNFVILRQDYPGNKRGQYSINISLITE
jgi:hypothetical protein